jgi:hypothetical protein
MNSAQTPTPPSQWQQFKFHLQNVAEILDSRPEEVLQRKVNSLEKRIAEIETLVASSSDISNGEPIERGADR